MFKNQNNIKSKNYINEENADEENVNDKDLNKKTTNKNDTNSKVKKFLKGLLKFVIILLVFCSTCIGVFYVSYNYILSKSDKDYERSFKSHISSINNLNNEIGNLADSGVFITAGEVQQNDKEQKYTSQAITKLSSIIDKLKNEQDAVKNLNPPNKFEKQQASLLTGLNNNYLLYKEILNVLKYPDIKSIETNEQNVKTYKNNCINNYVLISNSGTFSVYLPDSTTTFIYNFISYADVLSNNYKANKQTADATKNYIKSVDSILTKFGSINIEYKKDLQDIRDSNSFDYDDLVKTLETNTGTLNDLSNTLSSLIIPSNASGINSELIDTLSNYMSYLTHFENDVLSERYERKLASSPSPTSLPSPTVLPNPTGSASPTVLPSPTGSASTINYNDLYSTSNSKYNDFIQNYNTFVNDYADYKNKVQ
ncbi:MAG: hypothetical protein Q8900_02865 [Bacillota bacterium]|nr:hypothetical protein [Bacillota bacterium]